MTENMQNGRSFSRRNFLKASAAAASLTAAVGLGGCSAGTSGGGLSAHMCPADQSVTNAKGRWVPFSCEHGNGCGGNCVKMGYVVDNNVLRVKTDTSREDSWLNSQNRACLKGRARRQEVFGESRLRYPMKRKGWQPGGGQPSNGDMRGKDEWEQISWDYALDLAASEIKRIYGEHGPTSTFSWTYNHPWNVLLSKMGGYIPINDTVSSGTCTQDVLKFGANFSGLMENNDRQDFKNADYVSFTGMNPAWTVNSELYKYQEAKEAGVQFIYVGPSRNATAAQLGARWIPVRPGTDTAFLVGVAGEMVKADDENGNVIDHEFLAKYTVGFDSETMPAGAKLQENFEEYLRGEYDGVVKDAAWASRICGTSQEDIVWYAQVMAKTNNVISVYSCGAARNNGAENFPQAFCTVGLMGGHIGKPGNAISGSLYGMDKAMKSISVTTSQTESAMVFNPLDEAVCGVGKGVYLNGPVIWKEILEGKTVNRGNCMAMNTVYHQGVATDIDIKLILCGTTNYLTSRPGTFDAVRAFRKAEFVMSLSAFANTSSLYADIILPACSQWEGSLEENAWPSLGPANELNACRELLTAREPLVEPLFECRSFTRVGRDLAERLGFDPNELYPQSEVQVHFNEIASATYISPDGSMKPIVAIPQDVIDRYGLNMQPTQGLVDYDDYIAAGGWHIERSKDDMLSKIYGHMMYVADPAANPRYSASGKYEIYSQAKADNFNASGLSDEPIKPYPNYFEPASGYEKTNKDFPYVLFTMHHFRRIHSDDFTPWTQEAFGAPLYVSAQDAREKKLKTGDVVKAWNPYGGTILRHCQVLESVMPGCVGLAEAGNLNLDESDPDRWVDRGGSANVITSPVESNYMPGLSGYNNGLVNFEKYVGELLADCERDPFAIVAE